MNKKKERKRRKMTVLKERNKRKVNVNPTETRDSILTKSERAPLSVLAAILIQSAVPFRPN